MLLGALIGMIVAIIIIFIKKSKEKKAMGKINNSETLDTPDYSAYFHVASEKTFKSKGFKFFDHNGPLYINGDTLVYQSSKNTSSASFNIKTAAISYAGFKKKMKWVCLEENDTKLYVTTFKQGAFVLNKTEMDHFIEKLKLLAPDSNLSKE